MRFILLALLAAALLPGQPEMQPFPMDWRASDGFVDLSFLLEAPAGKHGPIAIRSGRLYTPDGKRFRIWGVNLTGAATTPEKKDAPVVAGHLARFGVNCVRFHFLDRPAPNGLIDNKRDDTQHFDPERLDRFDFFVNELKKRGIYTNINLHVARTYKPGDGVRDVEYLGFAKAVSYFDDRLLELQRDYARALLTHKNPYTNSEYRHEPAVAIVELVNENSVIESWVNNRLLGKNTRKNPGTWTDITETYERTLTEKFNAWLSARVSPENVDKIRAEANAPAGAPVPRLSRDQFNAASALRFRTEAAFYMDLEKQFFDRMRKLLKEELGMRALLVGTSDHNAGLAGMAHLKSMSGMDIMDAHVYWQHPRYLEDPGGKRTGAFEITNTPMVNEPLNSTPVKLSRGAVAGKPFTVSEVNHPFPNEYAAEGIPILAAYGALQDWDGIFWYTFEHKEPSGWTPNQPRYFEIRPDPVKMSTLAAGALMFLRGDVGIARRAVVRSYSAEQVIDALRMNRSEQPYFMPGFSRSTALRHAIRVGSFEKSEAPAAIEEANPIASDTGEIVWHKGDKGGLVVVDTRRSEALIGHVKGTAQSAGVLSAAVDNDFCSLTLGALDAMPLETSSKMLLTTGARVANTGMAWNDKRTSLTDWGTAPTTIEPVKGTVTLKGLKGAERVRIAPLDGGGRQAGKAFDAKKEKDAWRFPIGTPATVWYLVVVER